MSDSSFLPPPSSYIPSLDPKSRSLPSLVPENVTLYIECEMTVVEFDKVTRKPRMETQFSFGGGTVISGRLIISAAHIIPSLLLEYVPTVTAKLRNMEDPVECEILYINRGKDIVMLAVRDVEFSFPYHCVFEEEGANLQSGSTISLTHHPFGLDFSLGHSKITHPLRFNTHRFINHVDEDTRLIQFAKTAGSSTGSSGCGIFNDKGSLIGINIAGDEWIAGFALHFNEIRNFIREPTRANIQTEQTDDFLNAIRIL